MPLNIFKNVKVTPSEEDSETSKSEKERETFEMRVMRLHTLFRRYGAQRHPKIESYDTLIDEGALTEYRYLPPSSKIIYISHEWVGTEHPDPHGDQFYHLLLLLERLQRGDVNRTEMHAFHSLLYNQTCTTTAEDWKHILDPQKTFIFYDGFCVSKEKREEAFRMIPEYIERCDFMFILAPGCTHFGGVKE